MTYSVGYDKIKSHFSEEKIMKTTGIVRNIDELGRVVVPKEFRKQLGIANTDPVEISLEEDRIVIKKYLPVCHFCGSSNNIEMFKGKNICALCIADIKATK